MAQTVEMKRAAFEQLMREHGFQYLGATTHDGRFIYERSWRRISEVAFFGNMESSFRIEASESLGFPLIRIYENGRHASTRDYSSPKRAINAIREIVRFAGYEM